MPNTLYTSARQKFLTGEWNWDTMTPEVIFVSDVYQFNEYDAIASDVGDVAIIDREPIPTDDAYEGYAAANTVEVIKLGPSVHIVHYLVIANNLGVDDDAELIAYIDTAFGLPFEALGQEVRVKWSEVKKAIFRL